MEGNLGKGSHDIMSLLSKLQSIVIADDHLQVHSNTSEDEKSRLSEEEFMGLLRNIVLPGHETTAGTLSWMLLELARHQDVQTKLGQEIRAMERTILKEVLRYHSVAINLNRVSANDDVLPLSKPIIPVTGEVINELPIPKGKMIFTPLAQY